METGRSDGRAQVLERARGLGAALKVTPAGERLLEAERRCRAEPEIQEILGRLRGREETFRQAQAAGTLTREMIRALREVQAQYRAHPFTQELELARTGIEALLREVNGVMANILDLDVGRIVGPARGVESGSGHDM